MTLFNQLHLTPKEIIFIREQIESLLFSGFSFMELSQIIYFLKIVKKTTTTVLEGRRFSCYFALIYILFIFVYVKFG